MACRSTFYLSLALFATSVHAQQFLPPEQVIFSGETYRLAYKNSLPDGRAIFEYTSNHEPIEKWSSLVTINYSKSLVIPPLKWIDAMKVSLDRRKPKPNYSLYTKGNNSYAKIVYEPDSQNPTYESNVQKSFHIETCGGLVVYQFAEKIAPRTDQTSEENLSTLKNIANGNSLLAEQIEKSDWLPTCN